MLAQSVDPILLEQLKKLQDKYAVMGQDLSSYLDGLLYADYLTYWDYVHVDTLLSLQNPKTQFPDEQVFIVYHQITELYFKLILTEIEQIAQKKDLTKTFFEVRLKRMIRYFQQLENSFDIMVDGMEREQFLKFRMSLLPASGFQSAQYRMIEICSTPLINLVAEEERKNVDDTTNTENKIENIYWRFGATELASGKKTLTLKQFEEKYLQTFIKLGQEYASTNLYTIYQSNFAQEKDENLINLMRQYDLLANVKWRMAHLRSAGKYLQKSPEDIKATGGTNWQKYLPPRFQRILFFPELWSTEEKENWGRHAN
ncbi:MAG: tryptophan 2,3-dioxygenase family protein [Cyclobacteriaceae bacterium]|jgi:tryptophan 2,3-dioxygenase|nr:tryptophan 2,3-dioxygenase family protein [Cytophagales bacterium]MCZ8327029.1 tryptophan 2,3-dioxygenase family protein [Cyclobacteriaceae bacterium]